MKVCTFFGHRDCPEQIYEKVYRTILSMIEQNEVDTFLIGNQGKFDYMVRRALLEIKQIHTHIHIAIVLAYLPLSNKAEDGCEYIFPDGIEKVPKRFCISYRNQWLIQHSDYVITYITHPWGGAAQFAEKAYKQGKRMVNII